MINSLKLVNFRNFSDKKIEKFELKNFIVGENGRGKTNTLEALSILGNNSILKLSLDDLVKVGEDYFFLEIEDSEKGKIGFYYSKKDKRKNFLLNGKKITKKIFLENSYSCVIFSPIVMNMMYLSPTLRREFLDEVLKSSFYDYEVLLKDYKKILKSRNSCLKAIYEGKASKEEIFFWDKKFIEISEKIYNYRFQLIDFFEKSIKNIENYFSVKFEQICFNYVSKVSKNTVGQDIKKYLEKNIDRDIILGRTSIGPHIDDFDIILDGISLSKFASRGEVKSVIIYIKLLEGIFIEKKTGKKPILIIDDLLSELDDNHKNTLIDKIIYYQSFISNIREDDGSFYIKI
ncbi:hypothetical protein DLH72_02270 [Candidatus Gracilibacteria bacterium]|nr:MAG: hypothetical protein DLH72_02270 [Candidatus Gracilibacteria bacterium]